MLAQYWNSKRHGFATILLFLCGIGMIAMFSNASDLQGHSSEIFARVMTYLTYSAGSEGFLITLLILVALTWWLKRSHKSFLIGMVQLMVLLVICFAGKSGLKSWTESPRPYTETLTELHLVQSPEAFYQLDQADQSQVLTQAEQHVSNWRTRHWQGEKDYSFPSGHTIFVAVCLLFFGGLLVQQKHYALAAVLMCWGLSVAYSRLWLGMHRPVDLVGSILFATCVYALLPPYKPLTEKSVS